MNRKKILCTVLALTVATIGCACSKNGQPNDPTTENTTTEATITESEVDETTEATTIQVDLPEEYLADYPLNNNIYVKLAPNTSFDPDKKSNPIADETNLEKYKEGTLFIDVNDSEDYMNIAYNSTADENWYVTVLNESFPDRNYEIASTDSYSNGITKTAIKWTSTSDGYYGYIYILRYTIDADNYVLFTIYESNSSDALIDFYTTTENPVIVY